MHLPFKILILYYKSGSLKVTTPMAQEPLYEDIAVAVLELGRI